MFNVIEYLENIYKRFPDKTAYVDAKRAATFKECAEEAKAIAYAIHKQNIFKQPVAIYMEKSVNMLISFFASTYSGNFYTPLDISMPAARIDKILEVLSPACIITDKENYEQIAGRTELPVYIFEDCCSLSYDEAELETVRDRVIDTDLLYVLFTSGSTGIPKGVTICHRAVIDYTERISEVFDFSEKEVFGNQAPLYFDNSILDIYSTMRNGATMDIIPKDLFAQPVLLLQYLIDHNINTIFWVPSALILVANLRALRAVDLNGKLKKVLFCGEVMPNKALNTWRKHLPDCLYANLYGPTEITDACTYYIVDREFADDESLPIGIPFRNTEILVIDNGTVIREPGKAGELCVRGTSLSNGYYGDSVKTAQAFIQNPENDKYPELIYCTGDIVQYNEYGEIEYLCRKDFQIKHMGHRIELGEIETAVSSIEGILMCCCLYDEKRRKIVLLYTGEIEEESIKKQLEDKVSDYMIPGRYILLETMPINLNGKIDRVKLKEYL